MNGKALIIILIVCNMFTLGYLGYEKMSSPKTGYIIIKEVFDGFEFKKELEKKLTSTKNTRLKILDSLELELKILGRKLNEQKVQSKDDIATFSVKRDKFLEKKRLFEEDNQLQTKNYDQQIISQLNQYVKDYGKQYGYSYIYGNDNNGSIMYGEESKNISKDLTTYINNKYKGINQ